MRALAQLLMTIGSTFRLGFLTKIGQGMQRTALIGDQASNAKRQMGSSKDKNKEEDKKQ